MKHFFFCASLLIGSTSVFAQVGIGTNTPKAFFNVASGKDVLFGSDVAGSGSKLMWIPAKSAFRVGSIDGSQWDDSQIGVRSFSMGYSTIATGPNSFAVGFRVTASGSNSTALGNNVTTNGYQGAVIIGDNGGNVYSSTAIDQLTMRFQGGYMLYTSNDGQSSPSGVKLSAFGNAWQIISDSTRKENFRRADGADFLHKIAKMRLGSWNYKGQDAKQYRHYGPMAQDFFAAFGRDELGTIGEDKSINQADFDGVNLIAIQALIQKIEKLEAENRNLKQETASLRSDVEAIKRHLADDSKVTFKP